MPKKAPDNQPLLEGSTGNKGQLPSQELIRVEFKTNDHKQLMRKK
jgi:hypothetical protein